MSSLRRWWQLGVMVVGIIGASSGITFGQTTVQASIIGVVTDESGAVLPGVAVTASSPSLQLGEMATVTDASGEYRLTRLDIGTYTVTFGLDGFQAMKRENIRLSAGFTAKLDVSLKLGSLNETITVSGASPVVDVASTTPATTFTKELLEVLPTSRDGVRTVLAQAPGARPQLDVGGSTAGGAPVFRAFGQQAGFWPLVEGIISFYPAGSTGGGVYVDYGSFEEVKVSTMGNDAEVPTRGVAMTVVVKSGGNSYHGGLSSALTGPKLTANNIDGVLAEQGIKGVPLTKRWDAGGDLGGFLLKDKIWFYTGLRRRVNFNAVENCLQPDGAQCETQQGVNYQNTKLTYQANSSHRFIVYDQLNWKNPAVTGTNADTAWSSRLIQDFRGYGGKSEWQGSLRPNLLASVLGGFWGFNSFHLYDETTNQPHRIDQVTLKETGPGGVADHAVNHRLQFSSSLTWYRPDGLLGNHNAKIGLDYTRAFFRTPTLERPGGNYDLIFNSGSAFQVTVYNSPFTSRYDSRYTSLWAKDEWRIHRRLTVNIGGRFASDSTFVPTQSKTAGVFAQVYPSITVNRREAPVFNTFVPRINAAYDLTGSGKTVLKGGWSRFTPIRLTAEVAYLNPIGLGSTTFRWRDLDLDRDFDFGETDLNPNGLDYVSGGNTTPGIVNPDEKSPYTDQYNLTLERELFANTGLRVSWVYSKDWNNTQAVNPLIPFSAYTNPVRNLDPGPDGVLNTADDTGQAYTYWTFPASLQGAAFQQATRVTDRALDRSYKSVDVAVARRLSNRWQMMTSYSFTRLHLPPGTATPNQAVAAGGVNTSAEWNFKTGGGYEAPWGVSTSLSYEMRSGLSWQRTVLFRGPGTTIPTFVAATEPLGVNYYEKTHMLDAQAKKDFRFAGQKLQVGIELFNLLNINTVQQINNRSGATFGRVTSSSGGSKTGEQPFIQGRNIQFSFNYSF